MHCIMIIITINSAIIYILWRIFFTFKWAKAKQPYRQFTLYEPYLIYKWIINNVDDSKVFLCSLDNANSPLLATGRKKTINRMAPHISHIGVHDHGFNNVSTYGNLLRLMKEGKTVSHEKVLKQIKKL